MSNERNLVCPNCGGTLVVADEHDTVADCPFCGGHVYFKDRDIENLTGNITRLKNDNLDDEAKRKAVKSWKVVCIIAMLVYAVLTFYGYHSVFKSVVLYRHFPGLGILCVLISFFGVFIFPLVLSSQRIAYNVLDKKDDKKVRLVAFFKLFAGFILIVFITVVVALIDVMARFM